MENPINKRIIKLKPQSKWIVSIFTLIGILLGLIFAFISHPVGGTKAENEVNEYLHYETINGIDTITICDPNDPTECLTIMDKNLGATSNDISNTSSYGYHYQRGNNYGFDPLTRPQTTSQKVDASSYGPGNYYSRNIFVIWAYDRSSARNDNLWGGSGDNESNNRGYPITNPINRQGPCNTGYHVPSIGEVSKLVEYWGLNYIGNGNELTLSHTSGLVSFQDETARTKFSEEFKLPFAGTHNGDGNPMNHEVLGVYWTSSPSSSKVFWLYISSNGVSANSTTDYRADGYSLRCFKDEPIVSSSCPEGQDLATGNVCITTGTDIVIQATATEENQTLKINKYFSNAFTVDRGDGIKGNLTAATSHTYEATGTYNIILSLTGTDRWRFQGIDQALVPIEGTTMTGVKIIYMPSLAEGFGNSATAPGPYFFLAFNQGGAIISLPEGSFDTSNITTAGDAFFGYFNNFGSLTKLPTGSFDISNISVAGPSFFRTFNQQGNLTSLPDGSFNISNISTAGDYFFSYFNMIGNLESLPSGSFNTSNISGTVGESFFASFNTSGLITSLPSGSFNISNIKTVGNNFFGSFNFNGSLTSLPTGSFNTSNISGNVGNDFFTQFNSNGRLTSLPAGSFNLSNITAAGDNFFYTFNYQGDLEDLPSQSFNASNIRTAGEFFFAYFNMQGSITSLPSGSFNVPNLTATSNYPFYAFNYLGAIEEVPDSFTISPAGLSANLGYAYAFISPNYTINRNVYNIVSGVTAPLDDRNTFSDNQPGRCGVHENRLYSTDDACSITYNYNGGTAETITKKYTADTTGVVAGSGIDEPNKTSYSFNGWYTEPAGGDEVTTVLFPLRDGETLYAQWICPEGTHEEGDLCVNNEQLTGCAQIGEKPANSIYNVINVTGTWNSGTNSWDIPNCNRICDTNSHTGSDNNSCDSNTITVSCIETGEIPEHSLYNVIDVTGVRNSGTNEYDIPNCNWMCETGTPEFSWDNDNFLDSTFWSQNPSDEEIIDALYGSEGDITAYTLGWPSTCTNMSVVHITTSDGLPTTLNENTVYLLEVDELFLQGQTNISNCSAIVSNKITNMGTKIYSSVAVGSNGIIYLNGINSAILDNISVDGYTYGHTTNANNIAIKNSSYNTLNNISLYNSNITCLSITTQSRYNKINNALFFNASREGLYLGDNGSIYNTFNNIQSFNTSRYSVYLLNGSNNSIFNNFLSYNHEYGIYLNQVTNNYFNNTLLYNNRKSWNAGLDSNYYFGTFVSDGDAATAGSSSTFPNVGWNNGQETTISLSRDYITNPILTNGTYLFNTGSSLGSIRKKQSNSDIGDYYFGSGIRYQEQPVAYSGTTLILWGNYNSGLHIGQRTNTTNPIIVQENSLGYHTEDNLSCTLNTKEVECTQEGKPEHSTYIIDDVPVTWHGTRKNGYWNQAENCAYSCDAGYELYQNGDCKKSNALITFIANPSTFPDGQFSGGETSKTLEYFFTTDGYYAAMTEEIQIPQKPHEYDSSGNLLTGWMFEGRYLDTGYAATGRWTGLSENTTYTGIILYARYLPFKDKTMTRDGVTFTIMDRNLGALDYSSGYSYGTGNEQSNNNKNGLFFQRGNNFGFPNIGAPKNILSGILIENFTNKEWGPGNYYFNGTFISRSNSSYNWSSENNGNLWGGNNIGNSDTNKQGPCPNGYHIPSSNEWLATELLFNKRAITEQGNMYCSIIDNGSHTDAYYCMPAALGLPFAGSLYHTSGSRVSIGTHGFYSSSNIYNTSYLYGLYFYRNYINSQSNEGRQSSAYTLRCFKDTTGVTLSYDTKGGSTITGSTERRWFAKDTAPANPTRAGSTFAGWYKDTGYTNEFIFSGDTYISEDTTIYAKWTCNSGFFMDEEGYCMKENISVTFIANPETFPDGQFSGGTTEKTLEYLFTHGGYYAAVTEEIQIPQNPHEYNQEGNLLTGWMFEGWYLDTGYSATSRWTGLSENTIYTGITLYARYLPFKDKRVTRDGVTFTIMDRNLGALDYSSGYSCANEQSNFDRKGLYFQRGNNFGFPNDRAHENALSGVLVENFTNKSRGPGNYYFNGTFIYGSIYWNSGATINDDFWGGNNINSSDSNKKGPCPEGYHIPNNIERTVTTLLFNKWKTTDSGIGYCSGMNSDGNCIASALGLPHIGFLHWNTSPSESYTDTLINMWASNISNINEAYSIRIPNCGNGQQLHNIDDGRGYGFVVRCFKDTTGVTLSYDSKGGTTVASSTERRWFAKDTAPTKPTRANSTFSGWYKDTWYTDEFIFSGDTYISEDTTLYAKWTCNSGYLESLDGQSCEPNILPYTVNHYQENTGNNGYTLLETEYKTGLSDNLTQATNKTYIGFTAQAFEQEIIQGNNTEINIYYDRNLYTINIDLNGGSGPTSITLKYGATITPLEVTKPGYSIKKWTPALPETMPINGLSTKAVRVLTNGTISINVNPEKNTLNLGLLRIGNTNRELTGTFTSDAFRISDTRGEETGYHTTISVGNLVGTNNANRIIPASNIQIKSDDIVRLSGAPTSEVGLVSNITNWTTAAGQMTYFTRGNIEIDDECKPGEYGIDLDLKILVPTHTIPDEYHGTITYTLYEN